jgi:putative ABC transport system permease protein
VLDFAIWHNPAAMSQDLKLALRMLRARPGFALVVLLTLALGIGANTAIFSVVNAVVLRDLPYRDPQRLFFIFPTNPKDGGKDRLARLAEVEILRKQLRSFSGLAVASRVWEALLTSDDGTSTTIQGISVSSNLFEVLGVKPFLGRAIQADEDVQGGPRVTVLTHASWLRRFGGDPSALGKSLAIEGGAARIVGVLPPGVTFPDPSAELWLPAGQSPGLRRWRLLSVVGRLSPGVNEDQARAELALGAARLEAEFPDVNAGMGLRLVRVHEEITSEARPTLWLLLCAVGLVLLIACANVANLMLARGLSRNGEMAVRAALGASRARLLRQLLTEGLLLALAGGALGALLARGGVALVMFRSPIRLPSQGPVTLDARVLAFTLAISVLTGVLFSLVPAWRLMAINPQAALRAESRGATGARGHRRLSGLLIVMEMALALVLLIGAGLVTRTVGRLLSLDPGFATRNLLTLQARLPGRSISEDQRMVLNHQLEGRLRDVPGVVSVGQISRLPLGTRQNVLQALEIQGRPVPAGQRPSIDVRYTTPDYFRTMGIPLLDGRIVTEQDRNLVTINTAAAKRFWPDQNPVGQLVRTASSADGPTEWHTVVGIVGSVRHLSLEAEPRPEVYFMAPIEERVHLVLRTASDPAALIPAVRAAIQQVDRRFAVTNVETMDGLVLQSTATRRFGMLLLGVFAALALVLASIGLYGVMSYAVAQRRKEIGVRMALGAQARDVSWMVVREGMALVLGGAAVGLAGALVLARSMSAFLYGVSAADPATLLAVSAVLGAVALVACGLAARRATKVEPMIALRET